MKRLVDLNTSLLKTCESWNMNSNYQKWHNTTSKDKEERIALRIARWRMLELPRKESRWKLREGIKSLMDPSCRTFMKNSGNKRMIKRKEGEIENAWWRLAMIYMDLRDEIIERGWNSGKIEDETIEIRSLMSLRNRKLSSLDETRIRITLCLSFTN